MINIVKNINKHNSFKDYLFTKYTLIAFILGFLPIYVFFFNSTYELSIFDGIIDGIIYGFISGVIFSFFGIFYNIIFLKKKSYVIVLIIVYLIIYSLFLFYLWELNKGFGGPFH